MFRQFILKKRASPSRLAEKEKEMKRLLAVYIPLGRSLARASFGRSDRPIRQQDLQSTKDKERPEEEEEGAPATSRGEREKERKQAQSRIIIIAITAENVAFVGLCAPRLIYLLPARERKST